MQTWLVSWCVLPQVCLKLPLLMQKRPINSPQSSPTSLYNVKQKKSLQKSFRDVSSFRDRAAVPSVGRTRLPGDSAPWPRRAAAGTARGCSCPCRSHPQDPPRTETQETQSPCCKRCPRQEVDISAARHAAAAAAEVPGFQPAPDRAHPDLAEPYQVAAAGYENWSES